MTNSWTDIDNASLVLAWGANPAENHPACFAHINAARERQATWTSGNHEATLVVVDPRRTRTALQADRYIRIRPGTDIALQNAVIRELFVLMEGGHAKASRFYTFLNQAGNGTFHTDGDATHYSKYVTTVASGQCSKYTDARFLVNSSDSDYERFTKMVATTGVEATTETADLVISGFPKKSADCRTGNTVYNRLKAHVNPYTKAVAADICGCTTADIDFLVDILIKNSRCSSVATDVIGLTANTQDPRVDGYRVTTILYAMGMTQHTTGAAGIKGFANIQTLLGNMGRAGGGINALRGIHNVQGSTDMGLLYGNIPAYSANPTTMTSGDANAFGKYMDSLWGAPLNGTAASGASRNVSYGALADGSYENAYVIPGVTDLQQRGFYNMTKAWFSETTWTAVSGRTNINGVYDLWPKGNGDDHITMFRQMQTGGYTKALLCWGQNPAVTEPNQSAVREGLRNLDTLVVVDMYETETAACKRRAIADGDASDGVTYLIPACSHVEEAGSVTNSARTLQWREQCTTPKGNSKADMELLLRLAAALDGQNAFAHIKAEWTNKGYSFTSAYNSLYGGRIGWAPSGTTAFEDFTFQDAYTQVWTGTSGAPSAGNTLLKGSEAVCEKIYREMMDGVGTGGTLWIYTGAYGTNLTTWAHPSIGSWQTYNRAKNRDNRDGVSTTGTKAYGGWGFSWLINRRVFYNNGDVPGDQADYYMSPDSISRLFSTTNKNLMNYSRWYRTHHRLADMPDPCLPITAVVGGVGGTGVPNSGHIVPGRFPSFTEPYETPKAGDAAYMAKWGRNTKGTLQWDLIKSDTQVAGRQQAAANFPLVLTTIRCVEHFQGGPTTRNNPYNYEAEPEPWVEINPVDARKYGIVNGDMVNVITARSNSTTDQIGRTKAGYGTAFGTGFRARVDNAITAYQRVAPGTVAIPWHWGDRGLSQGSRANDLCLDAGDANTVIPEYKACLCKIEKI